MTSQWRDATTCRYDGSRRRLDDSTTRRLDGSTTRWCDCSWNEFVESGGFALPGSGATESHGQSQPHSPAPDTIGRGRLGERIAVNLQHYRANYVVLTAAAFVLAAMLSPLFGVTVLLIAAVGKYTFGTKQTPTFQFGATHLSRNQSVAAYVVGSAVLLMWTASHSATLVLLLALLMLVCHVMLRVPNRAALSARRAASAAGDGSGSLADGLDRAIDRAAPVMAKVGHTVQSLRQMVAPSADRDSAHLPVAPPINTPPSAQPHPMS